MSTTNGASKPSKKVTKKQQQSDDENQDNLMKVMPYGRGYALFNSPKELNEVFKSLQLRPNSFLKYPLENGTTITRFGWIFKEQKAVLDEFLEHQDVERFFRDHPEVKRWQPPTQEELKARREARAEAVAPPRQGTVTTQGIDIGTVRRLFNKDKMFPGPVVMYLMDKLYRGEKKSRELTTKTVTLQQEGVRYWIYEGPEDAVNDAVEAQDHVHQKKGVQSKTIKVLDTLVCIRAKIPAVVEEEKKESPKPVRRRKQEKPASEEEKEDSEVMEDE